MSKARWQEARDADLAELVGRVVDLKRAHGELKGLCPFHKERTPSFTVAPAKGFYHCFGCGAHGTAIDFVMAVYNLEFKAAVDHILGAPSSEDSDKRQASQPAPLVDRGDLDRETLEARERQVRIGKALAIWRSAQDPHGTAAEAYVRGRGYTWPIPASLRYHRAVWHPFAAENFPALVAGVQGPDRRFSGVWRIYLTADGDKAPVENAKLGLGAVAGGAVRLGPPARRLYVTEGIETALAVRQVDVGRIVWAALSTTGLRRLELPPMVRELVIVADRDPAGLEAASACAENHRADGVDVFVVDQVGGLDVPKGYDAADRLLEGAK
jgi:hypothetical protein